MLFIFFSWLILIIIETMHETIIDINDAVMLVVLIIGMHVILTFVIIIIIIEDIITIVKPIASLLVLEIHQDI
jgi:hypothetical protein